eukprot:jgi/Astpho2/3173/fgenesh1_pg.00052_%23_7_t
MAQLIEQQKHNLEVVRQKVGSWIAAQPPFVEVAAVTLAGAGQGCFIGTLMGTMTKLNPEAQKALTPQPPGGASPEMAQRMQAMQTAGPWVQARNFAVMLGVNNGVALALKKWRKKEDAQGVMVAGFASGFAFSLVSGVAPQSGPSLQAAFSSGVVFAAFQGGIYALGKKFQRPEGMAGASGGVEQYARAQYMLQNLGLQRYERNIKKGMLTDETIMLWNESALRDVRIPPGPRLLILHHLNEMRRNVLTPSLPVGDHAALGSSSSHRK